MNATTKNQNYSVPIIQDITDIINLITEDLRFYILKKTLQKYMQVPRKKCKFEYARTQSSKS